MEYPYFAMKALFLCAVIALSGCQIVSPPPPESTLTLDAFDAVAQGMPLESVQFILGHDGTEMARTGPGEFTMSFDEEGKSVLIVFVGNEVWAKSQSGLEPEQP